jgi:hypothetical protein
MTKGNGIIIIIKAQPKFEKIKAGELPKKKYSERQGKA